MYIVCVVYFCKRKLRKHSLESAKLKREMSAASLSRHRSSWEARESIDIPEIQKGEVCEVRMITAWGMDHGHG